jgi:hypothetical protein
VVVGIDYSFPVWSLFYVAAEYRYDGSGAAPENYDYASRSVTGAIPYDCPFFVVPTESRQSLGVHYADAVVRVGFTEDVSMQAVVVANLLDGTGIVVPNATVNVGDRVALSAGAQVPFGKDGEYRPPASSLTTTTDFFTLDFSGMLFDASLVAWARYSF